MSGMHVWFVKPIVFTLSDDGYNRNNEVNDALVATNAEAALGECNGVDPTGWLAGKWHEHAVRGLGGKGITFY